MTRGWRGFRSVLADDIKAFLAYRRALGRRYWTEEAALRLLDRFLVERRIRRAREINDEMLGGFFESRPRNTARSFNHLVGVVERFFDWTVRQERLRVSPVVTRRRRRGAQLRPFIFSEDAVQRLLELASQLPDAGAKAPGRGRTYRLIFGILYALGLRVGELARLRWVDVDFTRCCLVIRKTKFGKSRLVPFGPRVGASLREHRQAELRHRGELGEDAPVFSRMADRPIHPASIAQTFHALVPKLSLCVPKGVRSPHLHDLRHSFAVGTLLRWYRAGVDANSRLLHLATFLGHVDASSTAVYLTMTVELLDEANRRFSRFVEPALCHGLA